MVRRVLLCFLICLLALPSVAQQRKRVAVVLGGGGAKGVAHIGVLKVLEEAGIPIDCIAGTSMGAIVGGLYAIGYSAEEIEQMVRRQDWQLLLSDKVERSYLFFPEKEKAERYILSLPFGLEKKDRVIDGVVKGQNLLNLFSDLTIGYHDSVDFNAFRIPFACVAVDVVTGRDYVFRKGSLPLAMRASMAIPAVFTPVRLDSMVLVDGGLNNNYPANVAVEMGADVIIGVDLSTSDLKTYDQLNTPGDIIGQIVALHGNEKYAHNREQTDLLFRPDVSAYTSASFTPAAIDTMMRRGEAEARRHWAEILALKQQLALSDTSASTPNTIRENRRPLLASDTFRIQHIYFKGADPRDLAWLHRICGLKENSSITLHELRKAMSVLVGTNAYAYVNYQLTGSGLPDLVFTLQPKSESSVNLGLRFDSEEIIGVLVNATYHKAKRNHSRFAFTGRIGSKISSARLDYSVERSPLRNFNLSYQFSYNDLNIYERGDKRFNTTYMRHLAELAYSDMNWLNFRVKAGLRYEYFDYNDYLFTGQGDRYDIRPEGFFSYFVSAHFESFDRRYFPSRGVSVVADYALHTDNFVGYDGRAPFSELGLRIQTVCPVTSRFSLLPALYGRVLIGKQIPYPYLNAAGGEFFGRYLPQQLPFAGISHVELLDNSVVMARLQLRQRIAGNHYITLTGNYGIHNDDFFHLFKGNHLWGGSLGYAYNSFAGPLGASFGLSNRNSHVQLFVNLGFMF